MKTGYVIEHDGMQFSPDGKVSVSGTEKHNEAVEAVELEAWHAKPDRFAVYVVKRETQWVVTTWLGTKLGHVYRYNTTRNNFGAKITSIRFRGTNGESYYGKFGSDWSQLCRVRKFK